MKRTPWLAACALLLAAAPAPAGNGHFLHGVGAVNSSMGGVATAIAIEPIGMLHDNPALLTQLEGYQVGFSAEIFADGPKATSAFSSTSEVVPLRGQQFHAEGDTEPGIIPAFGFVYHPRDRPWAFGFGLLGVAGFRTDWPATTAAENPTFAAQPVGFGAVKTDLSIVKIPFSLAYQVGPKLSLGGSVNVYRGGLSISPLPPGRPDCSAGTQGRKADCIYAPAENVVSAYAVSLQVGAYYQLDPTWGIGFSYTSPQDFGDYEWNSQHANPAITSGPDAFGLPRKVRYPLDGPQIVSAGIGLRPNPNLKVGFDARWVDYSAVDGAGGAGGFKLDRSLNGIGWRDIYIGAIGAEYVASPKYTLRAGFNYSQTPIRSEVVFTSLGTPPTFTDHYTVGLGVHLTDKLEVNLGAYWAPRHEVSGPLLNPYLRGGGPNQPGPPLDQQVVQGGTFTISEEIRSVLAAFAYRF
jgi:long-chain fatty acid transport protein